MSNSTRNPPQVLKHIRNVLLAGYALAALAPPVAAQDQVLPRAHSHLTLLAANAGLGLLTTIAGQAIRGAKFDPKRAVYGAGAGTIVFGGKVIVAENQSHTNLLGRQLAAVGGSAIQNMASGRNFLDRLSLPYGPARLHIDALARRRVRLKLDLARTAALAIALSDVHMEMDVGKTLLSGVAVFRDSAPRDAVGAGSHIGGVVTFRERNFNGLVTNEAIRRTMAHELVHVLQADFSFNSWGEPLERSLMQQNELTRNINLYFDLGLDVPLASLLNSFVPYSTRPWEREAVSLQRQR